MKKSLNFKTIAIGAAVFIAVLWIAATAGDGSNSKADMRAESRQVTVYKTPTCGCCGNYVSYLKKSGYEVTVRNLNDLSAIKDQYGIPSELGSCHTTVVDGYAVEGHVPVAAIEKLLTDRPKLAGIALPGMPVGSPGMPGAKRGLFEVSGFDAAGAISSFLDL